jgi:hypothetical protein
LHKSLAPRKKGKEKAKLKGQKKKKRIVFSLKDMQVKKMQQKTSVHQMELQRR